MALERKKWCEVLGWQAHLGQFEQVVGSAGQGPLGLDGFEAPAKELTETARCLDLTEHRLDRLLSELV